MSQNALSEAVPQKRFPAINQCCQKPQRQPEMDSNYQAVTMEQSLIIKGKFTNLHFSSYFVIWSSNA